MKKFYFFLSMVLAALTAGANVTDVVTAGLFLDETTGSYTDLGVGTTPSGNSYNAYAQAYLKNGVTTLTIRSAEPIGIVAKDVAAGLTIRKVSVAWPDVASGRTLDIYGSDKPFTTGDMFAENTPQVIGSIEKVDGQASGTCEISDDYSYRYVGVRSNTGVMYLNSVTFEYDEPEYCNNYEGIKTGTSGNGLRHVTDLTLTCGDETVSASDFQTKGNTDVYVDKTEEVILAVEPGKTVTLTTKPGKNANNDDSGWMHGYAWVDWNRDYTFTPELSGTAVAANSELVAFNYYKGYNSNGVSASDDSNGYNVTLTFNVPADLAPGDYRLRYIIAWDNINPCGPELSDKDRLDVTGGLIFDATLRYTAPEKPTNALITYTVGAGGSMMVLNTMTFSGVNSGDRVDFDSKLAFNPRANEGKVIDKFIVNGTEVEAAAGQTTYGYNVTVTEDLTVNVTFRDAETIEEYPVSFTVGEGGRMTALELTSGKILTSGDLVVERRNVKFNVYANPGMMIRRFVVNGLEIDDAANKGDYEYLMEVVRESTVEVTFRQDPAGIEGVAADEKEAVYYTIQGVLVTNPEGGLYIKVTDGSSEKVYIK